EGFDSAQLLVLGLGDLMLVHQERVDPHLMVGPLVLAAVPAPHREGAGWKEDHIDAALGCDRRRRLDTCWRIAALAAAEDREWRQDDISQNRFPPSFARHHFSTSSSTPIQQGYPASVSSWGSGRFITSTTEPYTIPVKSWSTCSMSSLGPSLLVQRP